MKERLSSEPGARFGESTHRPLARLCVRVCKAVQSFIFRKSWFMIRHLLSGFGFRRSGFVSLGLVVVLVVAPGHTSAAPLFSEDTPKSLGIGNAQACFDSGDPGCYTNWLELADIDQDGDFDLLMANGGGLFA